MIEAAKILYIEDNQDDAYAAIRAFQNTYINLDCVHNCTDAVHILDSKKYDLIICDIMMPGEDGLFFAKKLSSSAISTPFIFTSGVLSLKGFDKYHGLKNYIGFILKPITPKKIEELFTPNSALKKSNELSEYC